MYILFFHLCFNAAGIYTWSKSYLRGEEIVKKESAFCYFHRQTKQGIFSYILREGERGRNILHILFMYIVSGHLLAYHFALSFFSKYKSSCSTFNYTHSVFLPSSFSYFLLYVSWGSRRRSRTSTFFP